MSALPEQISPEPKQPSSLLRCGPALEPEAFARIRRRLILECCKWDPQVGDVSTLAPFPLLLARREWTRLAKLAERLTEEIAEAELELPRQAPALRCLGLPERLFDLFRSTNVRDLTPAAARVLRYDFHPTAQGWALSEVNSDVPGGFAEASGFTSLMAAATDAGKPAGFPIEAWAEALAGAAGASSHLALLTAPGYMEDHQIVAYLAQHLQAKGCITHFAKPEQITWREGHAHLDTAWHRGPLGAIVRFYQGEWLAGLPTKVDWQYFFARGRTPVGNPGSAILAESKGFPLAWNFLRSPMAAWREALPETRAPGDAPWETDGRWLVKSNFCNTGDTVASAAWPNEARWQKIAREVRRRPDRWIAQKRFEIVPVATPLGPLHPCLGIYVINGRACGIYGRLSKAPLVDYAAVDVAILISDET